MDYHIRRAPPAQAGRIAEIYRSDPDFLRRHLGAIPIDAAFILREQQTMKRLGFHPCIIEDGNDRILGVLDYKPEATVYLSLLMLEKSFRGRGVGTAVYQRFERRMAREGYTAIRIDVVEDEDCSALGFWEGLGFRRCGHTVLRWGEKTSAAVILVKELSAAAP